MAVIVDVKGLCKTYRRKQVLKDVTCSFEKGEIYGLVGNNGAGKTTLLRAICNLFTPTSGEVTVAPDISIGTLIERPGLYSDMSAHENLRMLALSFGYKYTNQQLTELIESVGLQDTRQIVAKYSMGMKQRLGIAMALIGNPDVLVLDEPMNGLDPQGMNDIRKLLLDIHNKREVTIILSSHMLEELFKLATRFIFVKDGYIHREMSHDELAALCSDKEITDVYLSIMEDN